MLENENCICTNSNSDMLEACGNCVINTEGVPHIRVVRAYNAVKCASALPLRMDVKLLTACSAFLKDGENSGNNVVDINLVSLDAGFSAVDLVQPSGALPVLPDHPAALALKGLAILCPLFPAVSALLL